MTKPKLTELAKARVDAQTKRDLEVLGASFSHEREAETYRAAFREFIERHRDRLPRSQNLAAAH